MARRTGESATTVAARLLRLVASAVHSYVERSSLPPEAHLKAALESAGASPVGAEAAFIAEAFHGCLRYEAGLLRPLLQELYERRRCVFLLQIDCAAEQAGRLHGRRPAG